MIGGKRSDPAPETSGPTHTAPGNDLPHDGTSGASIPGVSVPSATGDTPAADELSQVLTAPRARTGFRRLLTNAAVATVVMVVAAAGATAGYCKWKYDTATAAHAARLEAVDIARDTVVAMLSYTPDNVEAALMSARDRLVAPLRETYSQLITDVVIPGARQQKITALAQVTAVATVSATPRQVEVIAFVNQNMTVGNAPPTDSASTVQLTLDKIDGQWRASAFTPI